MSNVYGCVRVSSTDQNEDRQLNCMVEKSIPKNFAKTVKAWEQKEITFSDVLRILKFSEATFCRRLKEYRIKTRR